MGPGLGPILAPPLCNRAMRRQCARKHALSAEKEAGYADIDEVVPSTFTDDAIIEKK